MSQLTLEQVKEYYGKTLKTNDDLKTSACCTDENIPPYIKEVLKEIHDEVLTKFYGCGSPLPLNLKGKTVLDLGSGSGRDVYVLSKLVGESGRVIGVDMTEEQLEVARRHQEYHRETFGYKTTNVEFKKGFIEDLESIGIESNSIDLVVSNCVINLSPEKNRVFSEIFRVLKPGGELYFSDVFADRRIASELRDDPVLFGECLSGAMYFEDFRRTLFKLGVQDYRFMNNRKLEIRDEAIKEKLGLTQFYSATIRAFKIDEIEDRCEDYGQIATYLGGMDHAKNAFVLDDHHTFEVAKPELVCSNTAFMLTHTRFKDYFKVDGNLERHFGLFDCGETQVKASGSNENTGACC